MDGKLGAMVLEGIAKAGLYAPRKPWDFGFRQINSSVRPIDSVDDLQGSAFNEIRHSLRPAARNDDAGHP